MVTDRIIRMKNMLSRIRAVLYFILPHFGKKDRVYLTIAAVIKNEGPYIKEWIEYHKFVGVERFYLYDAATDNSREILQPYIDSGEVIYVEDPRKGVQVPCYNDAIIRCRHTTRWLAIVDADEFIAPVGKYTSLPDVLKEFEEYPALGANWVIYDSNGHVTKPDGLVIKNYTRVRADPNDPMCELKSIINPRKTLFNIDPHTCFYLGRKKPVTENYEPLKSRFEPEHWKTQYPSTNKIRISHYYSKSMEEYEKKCNKGFANSANLSRSFVESEYNFSKTAVDTTMLKYVDELEEKCK